jgi:hypothetical protein
MTTIKIPDEQSDMIFSPPQAEDDPRSIGRPARLKTARFHIRDFSNT